MINFEFKIKEKSNMKKDLISLRGGVSSTSKRNKDRKKFTPSQLQLLKQIDVLTFCTCSKAGIPHAIMVVPSRFFEDRIIIPMIQMQISRDNLQENKNCFLHAYLDKGLADSVQIKIDGYAEVVKSGKLFNEIHDFEATRLPEGLEVYSVATFYPTKIVEEIG